MTLQSNLHEQVQLNSRHVRNKKYADDDDDNFEIFHYEREGLKRGFAGKASDGKKSAFSEYAKDHVRFLFDKGVNQNAGSIDKSKMVSKHEAAKSLRNKTKSNQEGCWNEDDILSESQRSGLFQDF